MNKCEKCGNDHDGSFGSGRYCSKSCANSRTWSVEHKLKLSSKLKDANMPGPSLKIYMCVECGAEYVGSSRNKKCKTCTKKVIHSRPLKEVKYITDLSKRTITKLLKRADAKCVLCGWAAATCDIHHIVNRSQGGSDDCDNLIILCPNCHRSVHVLGENFISNEKMVEKSILYTFSNWLDYYHPSN